MGGPRCPSIVGLSNHSLKRRRTQVTRTRMHAILGLRGFPDAQHFVPWTFMSIRSVGKSHWFASIGGVLGKPEQSPGSMEGPWGPKGMEGHNSNILVSAGWVIQVMP